MKWAIVCHTSILLHRLNPLFGVCISSCTNGGRFYILPVICNDVVHTTLMNFKREYTFNKKRRVNSRNQCSSLSKVALDIKQSYDLTLIKRPETIQTPGRNWTVSFVG